MACRRLRLLQDGLPAEVIGDGAVGAPKVELGVNAHLDHLLLPRDGNVPGGKLVEKVLVGILQGHPLHRGEGPDVIQAFSVHHFGVRDERGRDYTCMGSDPVKTIQGFFFSVRRKLTD